MISIRAAVVGIDNLVESLIRPPAVVNGVVLGAGRFRLLR